MYSAVQASKKCFSKKWFYATILGKSRKNSLPKYQISVFQKLYSLVFHADPSHFDKSEKTSFFVIYILFHSIVLEKIHCIYIVSDFIYKYIFWIYGTYSDNAYTWIPCLCVQGMVFTTVFFCIECRVCEGACVVCVCVYNLGCVGVYCYSILHGMSVWGVGVVRCICMAF
jgi:hypothetical protein